MITKRIVAFLLLACTMLAVVSCEASHEPAPSRELTVVPPDPDKAELDAQKLPPCPLAHLPRGQNHEFRVGRRRVTVIVPDGYQRAEDATVSDQAFWIGQDSSMLLLTFHDGAASTGIFPNAAGRMEDEALCSMRVAGRFAAVGTFRIVLQESIQSFYSGVVDVPVERRFGVGLATMATTRPGRDVIYDVASSIRVAPN